MNLDGVAGARTVQDGSTHGYTLIFRNGFFETTWALTSQHVDFPAVLPSGSVEPYLGQFVDAARAEVNHWGFADQVIVMLSLIGGRQVSTALGQTFGGMDRHTFDRDVIAVPDVEVSGERNTHVELRPMYDVLWQSAGYDGSPNFDADGNWSAPRN